MNFCILPESSTNSTILLCLAEATLIYHCHGSRILESQGKSHLPSFSKAQRSESFLCLLSTVSQENLAKSVRSHGCTFKNSKLPLFYTISAVASFRRTCAVAHTKEPSSPAHSDRGQQHTPCQGSQNKAGPWGHSFRTHARSLATCSSGTS